MTLALSSKIEYLLQFVQSLPISEANKIPIDNTQQTNASSHLLPALTTFPSTKSNEFSIMSWNILIKDYHYRYYGYLDDEYKQWEYRLPKLQQTISTLNTDIICLQEAHLPSFEDDFGDYFLKNGNYQMVLNNVRANKDKANNKKGFVMTMTTPILFKRDKFKLIYQDFRSKATLVLLQFTDEDTKTDELYHKEEAHNSNKHKKRKKNTVTLDATKVYLWIANVHLEGDPRRPDTRFNQIKSILNRMTNKSKEYKLELNNVSAIFTGDFNAGKGEVVDDLLLNGGLKWDYRQKGYDDVNIVKSKNETDYKHEFKLNNAYDDVMNELNITEKDIFTFYARDSFAWIDLFYYTSNNLKCLQCVETVPDWLHQNKTLQCPNDKLVSDHLPIASMFQFII